MEKIVCKFFGDLRDRNNNKEDTVMKNTVLSLMVAAAMICFIGGISQAETVYEINTDLMAPGAKALSMGSAFTAVADNADAVFYNPAGIGAFDSPRISSTISSQIRGVNFTIPIGPGSLGMGFYNGHFNNFILIIPDDAPAAFDSNLKVYSNNMYLLSYGFALDRIAQYGENVYVGATMKYFDQNLFDASSMNFINGKGYEFDLGVLYDPIEWLSLGYTQQNCLTSSMGGELVYDNGAKVSVPTISKLGVSINLLGDPGLAMIEMPIRLNLSADRKICNTMANNPSSWHIGAELWPIDGVVFRGGIDQAMSADSVDPLQVENLTLGFGIKGDGIEFSYACRPKTMESGSPTHYFSISYLGEEKPKEEVDENNLPFW